jgi:hypothetical protein
MKVNKSGLVFLLPTAMLLLCRCDTSHTVDSPVNSYFLKYIGNEGNQTGVDFEVNPDGTFILLGTTREKATGDTQLYVVKVDSKGDTLWTKKFGGPLDEEARDVELARDGRIVILGNSYASGSIASGGSRDILLMTLTPDGTSINSRILAYKTVINADADDDATSVTQINDGFIIAGSSDNLTHFNDSSSSFNKRDALMERVNDDLTKYSGSWVDPPAYGQGSANVTTKIFQQPDNTFYAFGYAKYQQRGLTGGPKNDFDFWYFGLGRTGGTLPPNTFGSNTDEKLKSAVVLPSGGFFLGGVVTDQGNDDVYYTSLRSKLSFDSTDTNFPPAPLGYNLGALKNELVSVWVSQTSGYFILSNEYSTGNSNLFLMKIGSTGKRDVWSSPVIFGGQGDDFAGAVRELPDGKIVVFGTMSIGQPNGEDKMVLIKVNKDGQFAN